MSASLPSSVRLKGWVTTAKGLACTVAMASFAGSPVQVTLTELDADNPVRRKGWLSLPTPDWPLAEKVHDGSVEGRHGDRRGHPDADQHGPGADSNHRSQSDELSPEVTAPRIAGS